MSMIVTRREWERYSEADEAASVEKLIDFLQKRCVILERLQTSTKPRENIDSQNIVTKVSKKSFSESTFRKFLNKQNKSTSSNVTSCATEQCNNK